MEGITLSHVSKDYRIYEQQKGLINLAKSLMKPEIRTVHAVKDLSFEITPGELVGFIGENGAGKSTTIKMMSGILVPTAGEIHVQGIVPYKNRRENARNIGVIFGQKSRLMWDLPIRDSFKLYQEIYQIDEKQYKKSVTLFVEMLEMSDYWNTPARQLSLGQRMKAELSLAMLHNPQVMFLDEPTIGLDVLAKKNVRDFLVQCNKELHNTVIITSHDMKDLDVVTKRIIMIDKGQLFFDGAIEQFKEDFSPRKVMTVYFEENLKEEIHTDFFEVLEQKENLAVIAIRENQRISEVLKFCEGIASVHYFEIKPTDIEDIVRTIYSDKKH